MKNKKNFISIADSGDRLETLKELRHKVADALERTESARDIPPLSKQLREIMDEIESIEGVVDKEGRATVLELVRSKHRKDA